MKCNHTDKLGNKHTQIRTQLELFLQKAPKSWSVQCKIEQHRKPKLWNHWSEKAPALPVIYSLSPSPDSDVTCLSVIKNTTHTNTQCVPACFCHCQEMARQSLARCVLYVYQELLLCISDSSCLIWRVKWLLNQWEYFPSTNSWQNHRKISTYLSTCFTKLCQSILFQMSTIDIRFN